MENKIKSLCKLITEQTQQRLKNDKLDCQANLDSAICTYIIRKKYTLINIGSSGKYMIENTTGSIYGIKAYGVINRGHYFGTLDTINQYYWGNYDAYKKENQSCIN